MSVGWALPGYALDRLVGFGPTGEVWRAVRSDDGAVVAVKRVPAPDPGSGDRLRRSAAILGSLRLPHVVAVHDVVEVGDGLAVIQDLAVGGSLADVLAARGQLAAGEVVTVIAPLAQSLAIAHGRGLAHGRVSASNVVFTVDGRPMLADFGLLAALSGRVPDPADDIAALAALGMTCLGASTEAPADGSPALLAALAWGRAEPMSDRATAAQLADALLRSAPAAPVGLSHAPDQPASPAVRATARRRVGARPAAAAAAATAVVAAGVLGVHWGRHTSAAPATALPATALPHVSAPAPVAASPQPEPVRWAAIVGELERRRADAYRRASVAAMRAVYADGSRDLQLEQSRLGALHDHRLHVRGLHTSVRRVVPLGVSPNRAVLHVVDAVSAYSLVSRTGQVVGNVPARPPGSVRMTLVRINGHWRIAAVRRVSR